MTIEQKIKMALSYKGISQRELARQMGQTASNLNNKIKRETLTNDELSLIANILGGEYVYGFKFPDGTEI
ncbi:MAG: helix-turn-helix domain-containing protein [Clostridia bacterium]|nr:helix-turn-helix domain-containing protein [Clostridia bacterium]